MMRDIEKVLSSPAWTAGEKLVVGWQFHLLGDFETALFEAIARADEENLNLLARGFPDEVQGFRNWRKGDLAKRLRSAGLGI